MSSVEAQPPVNDPRPDPAGPDSGRSRRPPPEPPPRESMKETFESIAVALILAFVFRAFVVEAFVIPTGSMASTLMGRHYEVVCERCGYGPWPVGIPRDEEHNPGRARPVWSPQPLPVCPNCNHLMRPPQPPEGAPEAAESAGASAASAAAGFDMNAAMPHGGDRILVLKYLYEFGSPRRWDVVVFRFPGDPRQNYIKRLVGLPGEHIMILDGDVYVSADGAKWEIARKPRDAPGAQAALWNLVHTADHPPKDGDYHPAGVHIAKRWETAAPAWTGLDSPVFRFASAADGLQVARYSQYRNRNWNPNGGVKSAEDPRGEDVQISDGHAYNGTSNDNHTLSRRVVSDLRISCDVVWKAGNGFFQATLTKHHHQFTARLHADGRAELFQSRVAPDGRVAPIDAGRLPDKSVNVGAPAVGRPVSVELVNADYVAQLKVDGTLVGEIVYAPPLGEGPGRPADPIDLLTTPMDQVFSSRHWPRVELAGAAAEFEVRHARIDRDIYYSQLEADSVGVEGREGGGRGTRNRPIRLSDGSRPRSTREFFVLGDNSNQSSDGRFWSDSNAAAAAASGRVPPYQPGTVPEEYMTGKAFFVYWPSAYSPGNHPWLAWLGIPRAGQWRLIR